MNTASGTGWTLHHGDCIAGMRELADLSVDVVITDPPYEAEAHEKGKRQGKTNGSGAEERGKRYARVVDDGIKFAAITEELRRACAEQFDRVAMSCALVFCQVEAVDAWRKAFDDTDLYYRRAIPWVKPDAQPSLHGRWPGQAVEMIVLASRPGVQIPIGGKAVYYTDATQRGPTRAKERNEDGDLVSAHPTQKPLELMRKLVRDFCEPNASVLDAFAGSGTTGVAAIQLGRRFVGFELDAKYHEIACRRLSGLEAVPRHEQPGLFDGLAGVSR